MSLPKIIVIFTIVLFAGIGVAALLKKDRKATPPKVVSKTKVPIEIDLAKEANVAKTLPPKQPQIVAKTENSPAVPLANDKDIELPRANRLDEFFNKSDPRLPIVETITYRSRVPWQKGRPAWLSDYASYYSTSRHFIARSLNGKPDYFKQDVAEGDRFNVLRKDKNIGFYLLIDISRSKMWFYYIDQDTNQRVLVKDYLVGLGREDNGKASGLLTPLGKYTLGSKIAVYKPKMTGYHNGQKVEMIRIFGSRWIPFDKELSGNTAPAKGLGIHGVPWKPNEKGDLVEERGSLGKYLSDGCIRLATEDMEELFAIIITRPTTIELVKDFRVAQLPGNDK